MRFELNTKVIDKLTKFHGLITGRAEYMNGQSTHYRVTSETLSDGRIAEEWIEEDRLEHI